MNEDEFEYKGKTYVSEEVDDYYFNRCKACAFWVDFITGDEGVDGCMKLQSSGKVPPCVAHKRKDGKEVYFIEKKMNENEFEYDGKTYIAVEDTGLKSEACKNCVFFDLLRCCLMLRVRGIIPNCLNGVRNDGRDVHFVEKYKQQ